MGHLPLPTERDFQRAVIRYLKAVLPPGSIVAAVPNEQAARSGDPGARMRFGAARKASGVLSGFPDLIILLPAARTIYVELKRERTGVLSPDQLDMHAKIRALGHTVLVAESIEMLRYLLRLCDVPLCDVEFEKPQGRAILKIRADKLATKVRKSTRVSRQERAVAASMRSQVR